MALKTVAVRIEGSVYNINSLKTTEALKVFRQVSAILKDSIGPMAKLIGGDNIDEAQVISDLVSGLVMRLDDTEVEVIVKNLIKNSVSKGSTMMDDSMYEVEFSSDLGVLARLVMEIFTLNFSGLLKVGGITVERLGS